MPCKTRNECYYGRENACQEYDVCPREDGYNLADDFDNMIMSGREPFKESNVSCIWTTQKAKKIEKLMPLPKRVGIFDRIKMFFTRRING